MENLQKFIKEYFSLLNLRKMDPAVKAHYDKLVANNDFPNDAVKSWAGEKFTDPNTKTWRDLPNFDSLSDEELSILYRDLVETFAAMSAHAGTLDDDTKKFIEKYYGLGKLFNVPQIGAEEKNQIVQLLNLLFSKDKDIDDADVMEYGERSILNAAFKGSKKIDSPDVRSALYNVIKRIKDYNKHGYLSDEARNKFFALNLNRVQNALQTDIEPKDDDLKDLKAAAPDIFAQLFKGKKTFEAFKKYEVGEKIISEQIDAALYNTDYTGKINSENYIAPTYKDAEPNIRQKIEKRKKDFYTNVLKKYVTAHRDRIYIKKTSEAIFKAIDKAKIKPTDDLNALINGASGIIGELRGKEPFKAADHLKWLTDKLALYKKGGLSNSIEGALRWGYQMNRIVSELIKDAAKEGKLEEAKTALEVLDIMRYGTFTSRTLDGINEATKDMSIFSDGKLSWNKNEGVKFVTGALDKTIGFGIRAVSYAATGIINNARKIGTTFNNSGDLKKLSDDRKKELDNQYTKDKAEKDKADQTDKDTIADSDKTISDTEQYFMKEYGYDIVSAQNEIKQYEDALVEQKNIALEKQEAMEDLLPQHEKYEQSQQILEDYDINKKRKEFAKTKAQLKKQIRNNQAIFASRGPYGTYKNPITGIDMSPAESENYEKQLAAQQAELMRQYNENERNKKEELKRLNSDEVNKERSDAENNILLSQADNNKFIAAAQERDAAIDKFKKLESDPKYVDLLNHMSAYSDAKEIKEKAEEATKVREKDWKKWNEKNVNIYNELMAYWDFLQTGNTKNLFRLNTKKLQEKMNKKFKTKDINGNEVETNRTNMEEIFLQWKKSHSYAA